MWFFLFISSLLFLRLKFTFFRCVVTITKFLFFWFHLVKLDKLWYECWQQNFQIPVSSKFFSNYGQILPSKKCVVTISSISRYKGWFFVDIMKLLRFLWNFTVFLKQRHFFYWFHYFSHFFFRKNTSFYAVLEKD